MMQNWPDWELLHAYAEENSDVAFQHLMERYTPLVYETCLRELNIHELAQDVTQTVFLLLAQKAASFRKDSVLASWLFRTTRLACEDAIRRETKRQKREQRVVTGMIHRLRSEEDAVTWQEIEPVLNLSIHCLSHDDQNAILLRYFQQKSLKEVGTALGISEDAARMRIARALDKMRREFKRRGFTLSSLGLPILLSNYDQKAAMAAHVQQGGTLTSIAKLKSLSESGSATHAINSSVSALLESVSRKLLLGQAKLALSFVLPPLIVGVVTLAVFSHNTGRPGSSNTAKVAINSQAIGSAKASGNAKASASSALNSTSSRQVSSAGAIEVEPSGFATGEHTPDSPVLATLVEQSKPAYTSRNIARSMSQGTRHAAPSKSIFTSVRKQITPTARPRDSRPRLATSIAAKHIAPKTYNHVLSKVAAPSSATGQVVDVYPPEIPNTVASPPFSPVGDRVVPQVGDEAKAIDTKPVKSNGRNQNRGEDIKREGGGEDEKDDLKGLPPGIARKVKSGRFKHKDLPPGLARNGFGRKAQKDDDDDDEDEDED